MGDWLSPRDLRPGARMRLFCLPHAGSGAAAFHRWKRTLASAANGLRIDVCPVQLPGRESRLTEPPATDAAILVAAILKALTPALDAPFALFGHSMGALLAYALAAELERTGLPTPCQLFVSGRDAAHLRPSHPPLDALPDSEFLAELSARFGGVSATMLQDRELRDLFLPILRADLQLVDSYRPQHTILRCPVTVLAGADDPSVTPAGLAAWAELTSAACTLHRFAGDHFYHLAPGLSSAQERLLVLIAHQLQAAPPAS